MTASQLTLYKGALRECGSETIKDLTEDREPRRKLDEVWENGEFVKYLLEQGDWNFAIRTQMIDYNAAIEPDFGYPRGFDKPEDWVRTAAISASENFDPPLTQYSDEAANWFANIDTLYVQFVSNDTDYGLDYTKWTRSFTRWAELELATRVQPRLSGGKTDYATLQKLTEKALKKALANDVRGQPAVFPTRGSWARSRGRGRVFDPKDR